MTKSFACSLFHPYIYWPQHCMQSTMLGDLLFLHAMCTIPFESSTTSVPLVSPSFNKSSDFRSYCTCRTLLHCPGLQLSVKHTLHFIIALYNAVWSTNCFKCVCVLSSKLICKGFLNKSKYLKWLNSPIVPGTRLGTQKTPRQFFSINYPGALDSSTS